MACLLWRGRPPVKRLQRARRKKCLSNQSFVMRGNIIPQLAASDQIFLGRALTIAGDRRLPQNAAGGSLDMTRAYDTDYTDDFLRAVLRKVKTVAVVGASANPERPSYEVAAFLMSRGYRVTGVNPGLAGQTILGGAFCGQPQGSARACRHDRHFPQLRGGGGRCPRGSAAGLAPASDLDAAWRAQ
ncbi:protein of unknown function [Methylocella tundrae]|uniref:CoA-binding domain-containing protein n=1 Tax=Methylocella tundrae TaxID=227605 RepID=A0A4U8Z3K8_METTU|nr:protein of unknown function [Methylocella tundrae]